MSGFTKLHDSIVHSSIWSAPDATRIVWITMLAIKDRNGEVHAALPGLANLSRVSMDACQQAIEYLKSPDPYSRTRDHEGRRIEEIDGGWLILNHDKYRNLDSAEDRRAKDRERQRKKRERDRQGVSRDVSHPARDGHAQSQHADPDPDPDPDADPDIGRIQEEEIGYAHTATADTKKTQPKRAGVASRKREGVNDFDLFWAEYPATRRAGKKRARAAWARAQKDKDWPGVELVLGGLARCKKSEQWRSEHGRFIPNPTTWINGGHWDDELRQRGDGYRQVLDDLGLGGDDDEN